MKTAGTLSALLHGLALAWLLGWAEPAPPLVVPATVAVEVVFETPPPDPLPEPEPLPEPGPDPPSEPDRQTADLEPPAARALDPPAQAESPVADQPPPPKARNERAALKPLSFAAEADAQADTPLPPRPLPALAAPMSLVPAPLDPAPATLEAQAPAAVAPPPLPQPAFVPSRKPIPALAKAPPPSEPPSEPAAAAKTPAPELPAPEARPEPTPAPAPAPEPAMGAFSPEGLLANLADLQNGELQAQRNPELWAVIRALRAQIGRCWSVDQATAANSRLVVDIDVAFSDRGALTQARIQQAAEMVWDEDYKRFALEARRALERCQPFELPAESYDIWRAFTLRFVPRVRS